MSGAGVPDIASQDASALKLAIVVSSSSSPQLRLHSFSAKDSRGVRASSPVVVTIGTVSPQP